MKRPCILALGPTACVLNTLPLAHQMNAEGNRPCFAVAADFKSVLDSVSYVDPIIIPGSYENLRANMDALSRDYQVLQMQVKGHGYFIPKPIGQSWSEEAYNLAGGMHSRFCDGQFDTIVLDKRNEEEEAQLCEALIGDDPRPIILVNLADGAGSQFTFGSQAMELICSRFSHECRIINLEGIRLPRIGNLMRLFEKAAFLVTADNAMLHLAGAVPKLPYIAFIANSPTLWHGSYTRGNCLLRIRYDQYTNWTFAITKLIDAAITKPACPIRLVHTYHVPPNVTYDSYRRNKVAGRTWNAARVLGWIEGFGTTLEAAPRRFPDQDREMVYIKDLIEAGFKQCGKAPNEAIVLCNTDTCFSIEMYERICRIFETGVDGFCGSRRDFSRIEEALYPTQISQGVDYAGTDLFVFKPQWWEKNRDAFPDMVHGTEAWDCIMRWQMNHRDKLPFVKDLIYHERHPSRWEQRQNVNTLPSQKHNITLAIAALEELNKNHGFNWKPGMFGIHPARLGRFQQPNVQAVRHPAMRR